jgi:hypothetical protein
VMIGAHMEHKRLGLGLISRDRCHGEPRAATLDAVANRHLLQGGPFKRLYVQPAAGDNGLAIGCAFYGFSRASSPKTRSLNLLG